MRFRLRYVKQGGHYHCRFFQCSSHDNWQKNGDLVFDEASFGAIKADFEEAGIEVLPEVER